MKNASSEVSSHGNVASTEPISLAIMMLTRSLTIEVAMKSEIYLLQSFAQAHDVIIFEAEMLIEPNH